MIHQKNLTNFLLICILVIGIIVTFLPIISQSFYHRPAKKPYNSSTGNRILLIAPHPDDETLSSAGVLNSAIKAGKSVKIVFLTNGDGFTRSIQRTLLIKSPKPADYIELGTIRHTEALQATKKFNIHPSDLFFLGYPDHTLQKLWSTNWNYTNLLKGKNGQTHSPYPFNYRKKAPFCGASLANDLTNIILNYRPTDIFYPNGVDQHCDHSAANLFVNYIIKKERIKTKQWTYLVHKDKYPFPQRFKPLTKLLPPGDVGGKGIQWVSIPLSESAVQLKADAVHDYQSQLKVMAPFLFSFVRKNELFILELSPKAPMIQTKVKANR